MERVVVRGGEGALREKSGGLVESVGNSCCAPVQIRQGVPADE